MLATGLILVFSLLSQYLLNTKYTFPAPLPFHGKNLYNPYRDIDSTRWLKANFHLHTRLLMGLTAGGRNSDETAYDFYRYFGYAVNGISDYMHIDRQKDAYLFIPEYEHGYSYFQTHQLVLNAGKVCWREYLFRQTTDNKQRIIDRLKEGGGSLVAIVHPGKRQAYDISDFSRLGNYEFMEITNSKDQYSRFYDKALSSGRPVFLLADDDSHNLSDPADGAVRFNVINAVPVKDSILKALKTGRSYGVRLSMASFSDSCSKKEAISELPYLTAFRVVNDTVFIRTSKPVEEIRVIGQDGVTRLKVFNTKEAVVPFRSYDSYLRMELKCADGSIIYLNPVFRLEGSDMPVIRPAVLTTQTWIRRIIFGVLTITAVISIRTKSYRKSSVNPVIS